MSVSHADALVLRGYQDDMRAFAGDVRFSALWAGMGLGKTPVALHVMQDSLFDRLDIERWLVVAPKLVALDAWPRQLRRWSCFKHLTWRNITAADFGLQAAVDYPTGRRTGLTLGSPAEKRMTKNRLRLGREDITLVSWDMLPWLVKAYGANWPYDGIVLDEAIFAASATSDRHKAVWHVVQRLKRVSRVIELTGAPTPNGYEQLHGQVRLLDGGVSLGKSMTDFRLNWMTPDTMDVRRGIVYRWKLARGAREQIDALLAPLAISLKSADYLNLPEFVVNPVYVELPDGARKAYEALERDLILEVGGEVVLAPNAGVMVSKLMQIANGAVFDTAKAWHLVHDAKLDRLVELVEATDGPILLAYTFQHDWERIVARLGKAALHVKSPGALDRFRKGGVKVLCMHPASGAHGLDGLQEVSSTAIWFGATYNADHWVQFNARLHRDGQRAGRVVVHQLLADDTIENYVAGRQLNAKIAEQDLLLEAVKMRQNRLHLSVSHANPTGEFDG